MQKWWEMHSCFVMGQSIVSDYNTLDNEVTLPTQYMVKLPELFDFNKVFSWLSTVVCELLFIIPIATIDRFVINN